MAKKIKVRLEGTAPLLMNNSAAADYRRDFTKQLKKVTAIRKKTEQDHEKIAELQWLGALYLNDEQTKITVPVRVLEGMLFSVARRKKLGTDFTKSVWVDKDADLIYPDSKKVKSFKDITNLYNKDVYVHSTLVGVNGSKVLRTRPFFKTWAVEFEILYHEDEIDKEKVMDILHDCTLKGAIGDWIPKHGRFSLKILS